MCAPLFAIWAGRHNNGPIEERSDVRGGNVNTRVVKLQPLDKNGQNGASGEVRSEGLGKDEGVSAGLKVPERGHRRYVAEGYLLLENVADRF